MSVTVTIEGQQEASGDTFEAKLTNLSREALETLALEGYKSGELTSYQVRQMLGFETPMEVDEFLKAHGLYLDYTEEELAKDLEVSRKASSEHRGK